jgi:hypothetical protein
MTRSVIGKWKGWERCLKGATPLVCRPELDAAHAELECARAACLAARENLMSVRETLDHVLDEAFLRQSFSPLAHLFREEEAALAVYEDAAVALARAEEWWSAVRGALTLELDLMLLESSPCRMN